ncbi:D-Tyr-tRNAtyr deacylase [Paenibacillus guangzhouensis]|uniref:D-Tyr-tRNAtyr deacylase n=1 Tax=Paenibacillus guangzhouensis TaxID=1473112 RepID=UPI00126713B8|nr:D-Tyr-tRNAtyr deacylase [Paenibacillus guangzhouensis]
MNEPNKIAGIESYFQHFTDIDFEMQRISIYANLFFRNIGSETLENPEIMIHISPENIGKLSGKVLSPSLIQVFGVYMKTKNGPQQGWSFDREDWVSHGKKTGEYRIRSIKPILLTPGSYYELKELQIDCQFPKLPGSIQIDAYIVSPDDMYPVVNPICIHIYDTAKK